MCMANEELGKEYRRREEPYLMVIEKNEEK